MNKKIKSNKILILGGTGAMGSHLVKELRQNPKFEIYVTSRKTYPSTNNVHYIKGNAMDTVFLDTILQNQYLAIIDFMIYNTNTFKARIKQLLASTSQYVYLSSARCYSNTDQLITEDTPRLINTCKDQAYLATDEYALAKGREEDILRKSNSKNWTIIRPYITFSDYRLQLGALEKEEWLYRALHGRSIIFSEDISSKLTTLTYGKDVSTIIARLIGNPKALGEIFHITSETSLKWSDIANIYIDEIEIITGKRPRIIMEKTSSNLHNPHKKWQIIYDRCYNRQFDNSKIKKVLGTNYPQITKVEEGLRKCIRNFIINPQYNQINWKKEALFDRISKERTSLSEIKSLKSKVKYLLYRYIKK
ncbi:NAD-dependent epimerase/dehydratase family protein [Phocaeicola plebeius]|uniref:NAD-dependent epimerase/dehydratase family protein n=1 Tax=Phocaeicola plebeius TaxID=310297 RepID=UPI0026EB175D|nr:NAD-dependent epimerase/dehydratase family protein [Phocaeicola plebeius]MCI6051402.1 NAD-dependent epimerase/dehydratase family protein [Phocaeicola plebeius]MDD6913358.1 NAD-dependent epimerase/dehydratase family protein [Phocaeicola plebeius]MDY5978001.1 NAD-dependent epimerase/dehydratase family protein [Phocaeicola plebeius]